jgi:hypothetical protein
MNLTLAFNRTLCFTANCDILPSGCHFSYCPSYRRPLMPATSTRPIPPQGVSARYGQRQGSLGLSISGYYPESAVRTQQRLLQHQPRNTISDTETIRVTTEGIMTEGPSGRHFLPMRGNCGATSHNRSHVGLNNVGAFQGRRFSASEAFRLTPARPPRLTHDRADAVERGIAERSLERRRRRRRQQDSSTDANLNQAMSSLEVNSHVEGAGSGERRESERPTQRHQDEGH